MGLGIITGALSIVRTVLNWQNEADDPTWASIPNWYWRSWEVFFGIVAACIPTLRPGYKWLVVKIRKGFTKLSSANTRPAQVPSTTKKWTPPTPSGLLKNSKKNTTDATSRTDDFLPLQNFSASMKSDNGLCSQEYEQRQHYPRDEFGNERKDGLHIPGDMSTHRPGHFKRLDSEAKIGGDCGAEEVEERI